MPCARDRHGKLKHYKRLESLREYVLGSQHRPYIERFAKAVLDVSEIFDGLVAPDGRVRVG